MTIIGLKIIVFEQPIFVEWYIVSVDFYFDDFMVGWLILLVDKLILLYFVFLF